MCFFSRSHDVTYAPVYGLVRCVTIYCQLQIESAGLELRTRIAGGARRPLVAVSAAGLAGSLEGDEVRSVQFSSDRFFFFIFVRFCYCKCFVFVLFLQASVPVLLWFVFYVSSVIIV